MSVSVEYLKFVVVFVVWQLRICLKKHWVGIGEPIKHVSNIEGEILNILQNFEPENEESVTVLELLRDVLTDILVKIEAIDDSILALLHHKESEKELDDIITQGNKLRLTLAKLILGHNQFIHHQFQMDITKMMLKFTRQNLPSKSLLGMLQIGLASGPSMTLLFTKNKILVTLINLHMANHISV